MSSARNRELLGLVPATLLADAGFAAVFVERNDVRPNASLTYGAVFLGLCLAAHSSSVSGSPTRTPTSSRSWRSWRSAW